MWEKWNDERPDFESRRMERENSAALHCSALWSDFGTKLFGLITTNINYVLFDKENGALQTINLL